MGFNNTHYTHGCIILMLLTTIYCEEAHRVREITNQEKRIKELQSGYFKNYTSLIHINLQYNVISRVSDRAFSGAPVEVLNLGNNRLTCIPNLSSIHRTLLDINLSYNYIQICPGDVSYLKKFYNLRYINLKRNLLTSIPSIVLASVVLTHLNLQQNKLTTVSDIREVVPSLFLGRSTIDLQHNPLLCDCRARWIKEVEVTRKRKIILDKFCCNLKDSKPYLWEDLTIAGFSHCRIKQKLGKSTFLC